jgi:predicted nucleic acid-binding Zn ribbon protein
MGRSAPRPAALALRDALDRGAPRTPLAAVQTVWSETVGAAIATSAEPVAERDGELTIRCASATWAQELSLMEGELLGRLRERLGEAAPRSLKVLAG